MRRRHEPTASAIVIALLVEKERDTQSEFDDFSVCGKNVSVCQRQETMAISSISQLAHPLNSVDSLASTRLMNFTVDSPNEQQHKKSGSTTIYKARLFSPLVANLSTKQTRKKMDAFFIASFLTLKEFPFFPCYKNQSMSDRSTGFEVLQAVCSGFNFSSAVLILFFSGLVLFLVLFFLGKF